MNTENFGVDLKSLKHSKALTTSIEDDKRRREVDAAKKRAAAQNVDYPTFAAMVSAAHLQPVDRKSLAETRTDSKKNIPAWSFSSCGNLVKPESRSRSGQEPESSTKASKQAVLESLEKMRISTRKTGNEDVSSAATAARTLGAMTQEGFRRVWRSLSDQAPAKRLEFLSGVGSFAGIFRVELPAGTLTEILATLRDAIEIEKVDNDGDRVSAAVAILRSVSECSRFAITVKLMGPKNSDVVDQLFDRIKQRHLDRISEIEIDELCSDPLGCFDRDDSF